MDIKGYLRRELPQTPMAGRYHASYPMAQYYLSWYLLFGEDTWFVETWDAYMRDTIKLGKLAKGLEGETRPERNDRYARILDIQRKYKNHTIDGDIDYFGGHPRREYKIKSWIDPAQYGYINIRLLDNFLVQMGHPTGTHGLDPRGWIALKPVCIEEEELRDYSILLNADGSSLDGDELLSRLLSVSVPKIQNAGVRTDANRQSKAADKKRESEYNRIPSRWVRFYECSAHYHLTLEMIKIASDPQDPDYNPAFADKLKTTLTQLRTDQPPPRST